MVSYCFLTSILPQECGSGDASIEIIKTVMTQQVILQDNESRRRRCRTLSYQTTNRVGSDDAAIKVGMMLQERPCMVSYCFHSSIIPQECGSGNDATIKINQDGDDAASCPTDDESRRRQCRKSSYQTSNRVGSDAASRPTRR